MRNAVVCSALVLALVGCGSSSGGGTGGANGAAGAAGAGPLLAAETYAGTASGADCVGFPAASGCSLYRDAVW